ncbi:SUMF1/EgtB/PvdO family nonheme iron enzyme [Ramlibacter sp.]|uniref:SUMF1/EgtB/PvdO family nonheme iron enzyme n=1 Tax=Ramlibacter sp. TaxID=1917967 RepID=UPI003D105E98
MSADSAEVRHAGADVLSLALIDARNRTLQLLSHFEGAPADSVADATLPRWTAGHIAWLAESWIARNPQRGLGAACPRDAVRLASIDPQADRWYNPALATPADRRSDAQPSLDAVRAWLLETLETTLDLLDKAAGDDAALYFYRMALWHEDLRAEQLVAHAQAIGLNVGLPLPGGAAPREPLALPATQWRLGWQGGGFAIDIEGGEEAVDVPEFEIDAQPVGWSQFVEFIDEGGYDRPEFWRSEGWRWLERATALEGRRGPRHVEQIGVASGAVLQTVFGRTTRMSGTQNVMHASWWEADAFARWAGRRLPTEVEWEIAAHAATRRGFRWGEVREWTGGTLRPWQGFVSDPWSADAELDATTVFGQARAIRGASFATPARMRHPKARAWALPERDDGFVGFRTCAL